MGEKVGRGGINLSYAWRRRARRIHTHTRTHARTHTHHLSADLPCIASASVARRLAHASRTNAIWHISR